MTNDESIPSGPSDGYIRLLRKSLESEVFQNEGLWRLWCWCLMRATYRERWVGVSTGRGTTQVKLMPGEFVYGRIAAAKALKTPGTTIEDRLRKLEAMGNITRKSVTHYSIITVCNWGHYQLDESETRQPTVNQPSTNRHPINAAAAMPCGNEQMEECSNQEEKRHIQEDKKTRKKKEEEEEPPSTKEAQAVLDAYNAACPPAGLPKANMTRRRRTHILARLKEPLFRDGFSEIFRLAAASKFLCGDNDRGWRADLGWLVENEENPAKVLEGKYSGKSRPRASPPREQKPLDAASAFALLPLEAREPWLAQARASLSGRSPPRGMDKWPESTVVTKAAEMMAAQKGEPNG